MLQQFVLYKMTVTNKVLYFTNVILFAKNVIWHYKLRSDVISMKLQKNLKTQLKFNYITNYYGICNLNYIISLHQLHYCPALIFSTIEQLPLSTLCINFVTSWCERHQ